MTAEQKVISLIFQDEEAREEILKNLTPNDFVFDYECRKIFEACMDLKENKILITITTAAEKLSGIVSEAKIIEYIQAFITTEEMKNISDLIDVLKKKRIQKETEETLKRLLQKNANAEDITDELQALYDSQFVSSENTFKGAMDLIPIAIERIVNGDGDAIPTGYGEIDEYLSGGLKQGKLYIIAGRTGRGKSALMANIVGNLERSGYKTLIFSYEMKGEDITARLLQEEAKLSREQIKKGAGNISDIMTAVSKWKYKIDDTSNTISELENKIKRMVKKENFQCVFVDYIGLITGSNKRNYFEQVGEYTRRLKQLSMKVNVPIVALCQINRDAESINTTEKYGQQFRIPRLSNLSDSSSVEKDADAVLIMALAEDTDETGKLTGEIKKFSNGTTPAIVYIAKNRDGEQDGFVGLTYKGEQTKFYDNDNWKQY